MLRLLGDLFNRPQRFKPTEVLSSLAALPALARATHAQLIIFDKDDTLTRLHEFHPASSAIADALRSLAELNIRMLILSNSVRAGDPDSVAGIPILRTEAKKPWNEGEVRRAVGRVAGERVWVVGDRLLTDVYLANKLGVRSALVPPVEESRLEKHGAAVCALRALERGFLARQGWN